MQSLAKPQLDGKVFILRGTPSNNPGCMSLKFAFPLTCPDKESDSIISFEHWPMNMDDLKPQADKFDYSLKINVVKNMAKRLKDTNWYPESRNFTGRVEWDHYQPIFDDKVWRLSLFFKKDYSAIESGQLLCLDENEEITHIYNLESDLQYVAVPAEGR